MVFSGVRHDWGSQACYEAARMRPDIFTAVIATAIPVTELYLRQFMNKNLHVINSTFPRLDPISQSKTSSLHSRNSRIKHSLTEIRRKRRKN